ncbi:MAG: TonB-dependent receptor [Asticcacaulis sp.]|uniref:TonB-dependent receptor plug domain-containing protein n=1 Tax=Asticcacaulis sp. TaxID=1872648 RepID=UPI0039E7185C
MASLVAAEAHAADRTAEPPADGTTAAADPVAANAGVEVVTEIVVTGARGAKARTVADSPVPIDVLGASQLKATGATGLKDVLGSLIPSFSQPAQGGGGTSASVRPIAIRGLSGDYLLVLVNGKRRHTTALINNLSRVSGGSTPVDIDLIPTNAIGHLEVLRDGAAAQYGSDAISGVLNIILDKVPEGGSYNATLGQTFDGGGLLFQQGLTWATPIGDKGGFVRLSGEAKYHTPAIRAVPVTTNVYPLLADGSLDPREATNDHIVQGGYGRSNRDAILNTALNAELPVNDTLTFYTYGTYSYRGIKDARGGYAATSVSSLPQIYPDGFQAYRRIKENDFQVSAGFRGEQWGWNWNASTSVGQDNVWLGAENTLNPSLGPTSKTSFFMGRQISSLWVNNLDVDRDFKVGLSGPLQVALGVEQRWEQFENQAGEPDSYRNGGYVIPSDDTPFGLLNGGKRPPAGLVSFTGTTPDDATKLSRTNVAAYADIGADILKNWYAGVAVRAEHYDDSAGDTVSGKFSTRYEIFPGFALRGGVNSGFRAPSLAQTGFSTTQNTTSINADGSISSFQSKFLPVNSAQAKALGAQPLRPEKSLSYTFGATYERGSGRLTIDSYQIEIDDRIVKTEQLTGSAVQAILASSGFTDLSTAQYFTNAIDTYTRGIDVVGEYTWRTDRLGSFHGTAAYSSNTSKILHVIDNPPELVSLGSSYVLFGRQARQDLLVSSPKDKVILGVDWSLSAFKTSLKTTRYGYYVESGPVASADQAFPARWITDLDISYAVNNSLTLSAGANNLFNVYPKERAASVLYQGSGLYGSFSPYGLIGGFYYLRASYRY